jgi:hypothetical protein
VSLDVPPPRQLIQQRAERRAIDSGQVLSVELSDDAATSRTFRVKSDLLLLGDPSELAMPTDFFSVRDNLSRGCPFHVRTLKLVGRLNLAQGGHKPSQQVLLTEQHAHGLSELRDRVLLLGCEPAPWGVTEHRSERLDLRGEVGRCTGLHLLSGWLIFR